MRRMTTPHGLHLIALQGLTTACGGGSGATNADLEAELAQLQAEVAELREQLGQPQDASLSEGITANASDIAANASDIAANASDIAANASDIAASASDIATNAAGISTHGDDIGQLRSDLDDVTDLTTQHDADISSNQSAITSNEAALAAIEDRGGVVFTRWGRDDCPVGTDLVYAGIAAGGHYGDTGSGANTVCLHANPEWADFSDLDENGALLYGTEFQSTGYGLGAFSPFDTLNDQEGLCAVCLDAGADLEIMVPGRRTCPVGWIPRVEGYLMAQHHNEVRTSEYLCIDQDPMPGGSNVNDNGNLWYPVEGECGSLPCGPGEYVQDREITCVICTR